MSDPSEILLGRVGGIATLTINRPQRAERADPGELPAHRAGARRLGRRIPAVHAVVVRGAGGRAFCAGGDVRAVYEAGRGISGNRELTCGVLSPRNTG